LDAQPTPVEMQWNNDKLWARSTLIHSVQQRVEGKIKHLIFAFFERNVALNTPILDWKVFKIISCYNCSDTAEDCESPKSESC
jgi:hypothetical protein